MNNPEYILEDVMGGLVAKASAALLSDGIISSAINYQYSYFDELKTTLAQSSVVQSYATLKYPLVWLVPDDGINRKTGDYFGDVNPSLYIINDSNPAWTYAERMTYNVKPILLPIYRELIRQILATSHIFEGMMNKNLPHKVIKRPYWGPEQQDKIDDVFDCIRIDGLQLKIANNPNCSISTKFF